MDDDGDIVGGWMIAQSGKQLKSICSRQEEIQEYQVRPLLDDLLDPLGAIAGKSQRVRGAVADNPLEVFLGLGIVVDHQQIGHGQYASIILLF